MTNEGGEGGRESGARALDRTLVVVCVFTAPPSMNIPFFSLNIPFNWPLLGSASCLNRRRDRMIRILKLKIAGSTVPECDVSSLLKNLTRARRTSCESSSDNDELDGESARLDVAEFSEFLDCLSVPFACRPALCT